jgi:hypothetical protein
VPAKPAANRVLPPDDARVRESRRLQVQKDADAIRSECSRAARGDWRAWQDATSRYRDALKARLAKLKKGNLWYNELLVGRDLPIFQSSAQVNLAHVFDPEHWDKFRKARVVVAGNRWLRERGVDLIFIAVPTMPEVYMEQFLDDMPPDGIVAPHIRRTFLDLLESDVEVVNTFRLMRDDRAAGFLYLPADHHWNQLGMRGTVRDVAQRIGRYDFGRQAKADEPTTTTKSGPYILPSSDKAWRPLGAGLITDDQWKAALGTLPPMDYITSPDGSPVPDDPRSPVMLIGNSFALHFRELLIRETNLRPRTRWGNGNTTNAFIEFLREPEVLDGVRVVIWLTADHFLDQFTYMPDSILEMLQDPS